LLEILDQLWFEVLIPFWFGFKMGFSSFAALRGTQLLARARLLVLAALRGTQLLAWARLLVLAALRGTQLPAEGLGF
jgi:hypothetical protein